jgi:hypothetical protein
MQVIRLDKRTFNDLQTYGLTNILNELFNFMQTEIAKGNVIVIEQRYSNAQPDTLHSIRNDQELTEFKNKF